MTGSGPGAGGLRGALAIDRLLLALAIVAGAAIRIIPPWRDVFSGPGAAFLTPDPYYHLRRIQYAVAHFPRIIDFDPFVNFPEGARIVWPPGFDLLLAAAAKLFARGGDAAAVERLSAVAVPLLALVSVLAVYAFARQSLARPGAGIAALTFALLPVPVFYGHLGYVDHHVVEPVFMALGATLLLAAWRRTGGRAALWGTAGGVTATLACAFAPQGIATAALVCALAALEGVLGRFPGSRPAGFGAVLAGTLTLVALAAATPWGRSGEMTYLALSPFQSHLAVAAAGVACAIMIAAWRGLAPRGRLAGAALGLAVAAGALIHGGSALLGPLRDATEFLARSEALAATVRESMPLWSKSPGYLLQWLTLPGVLAPLFLLAALWRERRSPASSAALLALVLYAMGVAQLRFMVIGGIAIAWATGWAVARIWEAGEGRGSRAPARVAALAVVIVSLGGTWAPAEMRSDFNVPGRDLRALAAALHARRDPAAGLLQAGSAPRWGVIAPWSIGHHLIYWGEAPVVASTFGMSPWHIEGVYRGIAFLLTESDAEAAAYTLNLGVRYVVTTDPFQSVLTEAGDLGLPTAKYFWPGGGPPAGGEGAPQISPAFLETTAFRLHLLDGSAHVWPRLTLPALASFRLVWESPGRRASTPAEPFLPGAVPSHYKLFEVVKGARLEGRCAPGAPVAIAVPVRTNTGRALTWTDVTPCGAAGRYALRTPHPGDAIVLSQGDRRVNVAVTEAQIRSGGMLRADL